MEDFLRIDMHVHTKGVSKCSCVSVEEAVDLKIADGYDGFVLTNHCQSFYYPEREHGKYIESVIDEYKRAKDYGMLKGFKVFLGLEVSIHDPFYSDWLLYGATEEFLRDTPCLYKLNQRELYKVCQDGGVLLVQAHAYRSNLTYCDDMRPGYPDSLDGLEINCTPRDFDTREKILATAKEMGKFVVCGTDYHAPDGRVKGGTFLPRTLRTAKEIADYLRKIEKTELFFGKENISVKTFLKN